MKAVRLVSLFSVGALLAALVLSPAFLTAQEKEKKEEKKKARKVWTNEDLKNLSGRGVSVVGQARRPAAEEKESAKMQPEKKEKGKNFYSDMAMEERQQWIQKLEQENAQIEQQLRELRDRLFEARDDEQRRQLGAQIDDLERGLEENRAEIELIRNTPPPPAKPAQPAQAGQGGQPQPESPPAEEQPGQEPPPPTS